MKKALILLSLLLVLAVQHAGAQNAIVNIPVGALRAAYRASFGHNPDFGKYEQLALAINRAKSRYFPGAAGGFWNGVINENADHSKDTYSIVTVGQGPFTQNPQNVPTEALKALFANRYNRVPNLANYQDLALAIDAFQAQKVHCAGGFWNGEQVTGPNGNQLFRMVWTGSPNSPQNVPVSQLVNSFSKRAQRAPNFYDYADMAFAVTCWIDDHAQGNALGGFWNGEQTPAGPGQDYGIVLVR